MRRLSISISVLFLVAGCTSGAQSPSTSPGAAGFGMTAWISQALPPVGAFRSAGPSLVIDKGSLIVEGPQVAIYPGPLLPNLQQRPISQGGIDAIVAAARAAGLLDGPTDLVGESLPGSQTAHIRFVIDGVAREVVGDPTRHIECIRAPCVAPPGTPEAFGPFWSQVQDLQSWLGAELGPVTPYAIDRLAVLLIDPVVDAALRPSFARWPLDVPMAQFGVEWPGSPPARCGVIEGANLAATLSAFGAANELTRWTDDGDAQFSVVARALFPGEPDPC